MTPQDRLKEIKEQLKDPEYIHFENDIDWLIKRVEQLEKALEFYASPWGKHHGSPINEVNKFTQNRLNETRDLAIKSLEEMP